jgi:hypothetical protein
MSFRFIEEGEEEGYIESNVRMSVNTELQIMWKELVVA